MKFNELLNRAAAVIPPYRQIVFKTIIIAVCAGGSPGRVSNVFRKFALLLTGDGTLKKFYNFLNSGKLPWDVLRGFLTGIISDPTVDGRLLIGLLLFGHDRWACLPFAQKLYLPLPKTVKSSAKLPHAEWLKTKSGIGAELVIRLVLRFKRPVLIVCDSWFGTKPLLKEVRNKVAFGVHILSRLRISAILYDMPEFVPGKRTGAFAFADIRRKISGELAVESIFPERCPKDSSPPLNSSATQF